MVYPDLAGFGPWSDLLSFTTPIPTPPLPTQPTLISPSGAITDNTPTYTWNATSRATGYHLYVNDSTGDRINQWYTADACGCASRTGTCSVTPTTDVIGSCKWWIQTYNSAGIGSWSDPLEFTTPIQTPPAAALISPSGTISDNTPTYTWNAVSNATWYQLYVNDSTGNKIQRWYAAAEAGCPDGTGTCSVAPTIEVLGSCKWYIRTYNSAGYGPWSLPGLSFTTPIPTLPPVATLVSPSGPIKDTTPPYMWNAVSNSTWYCLYGNDSTGNKIQQWYSADACGCASGTGTCSVTPTTEVLGSCKWWIRTYNSAGFGSWSDPLEFTTPTPTPPIAATQISPTGETADNTPTYTWNPVSNATWYCLYVNDSTGNKISQWYAAADAGCPDGIGTCSVTPAVALAPGAGQWYIRTYNSAGYGPWSLPGKNFIILTQSLYDDFSEAYINKDKWRQGELVREIDGGKLLFMHASPNPVVITSYPNTTWNDLNFSDPNSVNSIQADVTILENTIRNSALTRTRIAGRWYNDGTAGEGMIGDVWAEVSIREDSGGLYARWEIAKMTNPDGTTALGIGGGNFTTPINVGTVYKLYIGYNSGQFLFKIDNQEITFGPAGLPADAGNPKQPSKQITTRVQINNAISSGYIAATFDNVYKNGSLYDDFSSLTIDQTKWATYELVREISGEKLRSKIRSSSATTSAVYNNLDFLYPSTIDFIQVNVTPVSYQNSQGAQPVVRIAGYYYNDGTGIGVPGDHTGDVAAQVWIGGIGVNPEALWMVSRSADSAGQVPVTLASGTFTTPISLGNTQTLSLGWDGNRLTFRINNEEASYTPATAINPPNVPWKSIGTRIWDPAGKEATIEALFDDVMTCYGPPSAATLVSPSGTIPDPTPNYTWIAVSDATWYQLWVNDSTGNKIQKWHTASEVGCASGTGTCSVTPTTEVIGSCKWWVQTYNAAGFGPWSDPLSFQTTPPVAATLVSPSGTITDTTPTYIWNAVAGATWYQLVVNDSTGTKIQQWYSASACGCASGTGTCSVTPAPFLIGGGIWKIQTYNSAGFGPWSSSLSFSAPSLSGRWSGILISISYFYEPDLVECTINQNGNNLSGTITIDQVVENTSFSGTISGNSAYLTFSFWYEGYYVTANLNLTLTTFDGNSFSGNYALTLCIYGYCIPADSGTLFITKQ